MTCISIYSRLMMTIKLPQTIPSALSHPQCPLYTAIIKHQAQQPTHPKHGQEASSILMFLYMHTQKYWPFWITIFQKKCYISLLFIWTYKMIFQINIRAQQTTEEMPQKKLYSLFRDIAKLMNYPTSFY